jgi:hypothetical protein
MPDATRFVRGHIAMEIEPVLVTSIAKGVDVVSQSVGMAIKVLSCAVSGAIVVYSIGSLVRYALVHVSSDQSDADLLFLQRLPPSSFHCLLKSDGFKLNLLTAFGMASARLWH